MVADRKEWPFPVNESILDDQGSAELEFLSFKSPALVTVVGRTCLELAIMELRPKKGRSTEIVVRGRRRWEVVLAEKGEKISSTLTSDFAEDARLAIQWVKGENLSV